MDGLREWNGWMDGWRERMGMGREDLYSGMKEKEIFFKKKKKICLRGRMEDFFLKFFFWLNNYRGRGELELRNGKDVDRRVFGGFFLTHSVPLPSRFTDILPFFLFFF